MTVGQFVRWVRYDDDNPFDMTLWAGRFKFARGEIMRIHHDGRLEIFWRWKNGESSISLHWRGSVAPISLLDVIAEEAADPPD